MPPFILSGHGMDPALTDIHRAGGPAGDAIAVVGIGAPENIIGIDGYPETSIAIPPGDIGDTIVVSFFAPHGTPTWPTVPVNWISYDVVPGGGLIRYYRVATNDIDDAFIVAARVANYVQKGHVQAIRLRAANGHTVLPFQSGIKTVGTSLDFELDAITAGTEANDTFVIGQYGHAGSQNGAVLATNLTNHTGLEIISSTDRGEAAGAATYLWYGWGYVFHPVSEAIAYQDMDYGPTILLNGLAIRISMFTRFRAIP